MVHGHPRRCGRTRPRPLSPCEDTTQGGYAVKKGEVSWYAGPANGPSGTRRSGCSDGMPYRTGDYLSVLPENDPGLVARTIERLGTRRGPQTAP